MPEFDLVGQVAGVEFAGPFEVSGAAGDSVQARLGGGALRQAATAAPLTLAASYDAAAEELTLRRDFTPAARLLGGELELASLTLTIACRASGARRVLDTAAARPIQAAGEARWVGDVPQTLGAPGGAVALTLSYTGGGFALRLAAPVSLGAIAVDLAEGEAAAELLPAEQAVVLSLAGRAGLRQDVADQVEAALAQVLGAGAAPALDSPAFRLRRKLRLSDLAPLEPPALTLLPPLAAGAAMPPLPGLSGDLDLALGLPQIDFGFPDGGGGPSFGLEFRDCSLAFPSLAGLEAFRIDGRLRVHEDAAGALSFAFAPAATGGVDLPAAFRFLLARIEWLAGLADLDDLPDLLALGQGDAAWFEKLRALLPDPGDPVDAAVFRPAFDAIVASALALGGAPDLPRLFALALSALEERADELYGLLVDAWLDAGGTIAQLRELLLQLPGQLPALSLDRLLAELLAASRLDPGDLLGELLEHAGGQPLDALGDFLALWVRVLAAALEALDPGDLAAALDGVLKGASQPLQRGVALGELPVFGAIGGLDLPTFKLPLGTLLTGVGFQGLLLASDVPTTKLAGASLGVAVEELFGAMWDALLALLAPFSLPKVDATMVLGLMIALFTNAQGDPRSEVILLQWARIPFVGWILPIAAAIRNLGTPAPWTSMLWRPIEDDPAVSVKHLPKPGPDAKYLIFSDLHRDAAADRLRPFRFGAISHFLDNQELYLDVLEWADGAGYTILEAGDCEELWFIRDFSTYQGPADQLRQVLDTNVAVYDKLVSLHERDRYFRLYGNHDSHLRDPAVRQALVDRFEQGAAATPFAIHDFFVIDGVKRMDDHGVADIFGDVLNPRSDADDLVGALLDSIGEGRLGFDSEPFSKRAKLIVTHGHQFDFWNCDPHNLAGKMIANAIGVPVDSLDDPLHDLGGIALGGTPLLDFQETLGRLPVFSNFPAYDASRQFAHRIQHQHDSDRVLINDIFYWEAIPALMASFAMPLHLRGDDGLVTQRWSQANTLESWKFLDHAICVGHTHFPQSRPYYDIAALLLSPPLKATVDLLREGLAQLMYGFKLPLNFIRAQYYNSGTVGWMEGVIWAIQVDEHGQARLVFWTRDTKPDRPQEMDWELQRWDPSLRDALDARRQAVAREVNSWIERVAEVLLAAGATVGSLSTSAVLALAELLSQDLDRDLDEVDPLATSTAELPEAVAEAASGVAEIALQLMLALLSHQVSPAAPARTLRVRVPLSPAVAARLEQLRIILAPLPDVTEEAALHHAAVWLTISEQMPFVNGGPFRGQAELASAYPVLWAVLSLLPLLPAQGLDVGGATVSSAVAVDGGRLSVTVTVA